MRVYAKAAMALLIVFLTFANPSQGAAGPGLDPGPTKMTTVNLISAQEMIVTVNDEVVKARVLFSYQIKSAPVSAFSITVPEGWQAVNVQGDALGKWTQNGRTIKSRSPARSLANIICSWNSRRSGTRPRAKRPSGGDHGGREPGGRIRRADRESEPGGRK